MHQVDLHSYLSALNDTSHLHVSPAMSLLQNVLRSQTIDSLDKKLSNITLNRYNVQGDLEKDIDSDDELVNVVSFLLSAIFAKFKVYTGRFRFPVLHLVRERHLGLHHPYLGHLQNRTCLNHAQQPGTH